jgi:hypothetical protein
MADPNESMKLLFHTASVLPILSSLPFIVR